MNIKSFHFLLFVLLANRASAQTDIVVKGDTLLLAGGAKFWLGEQVTLNQGSLPDKSFNFIYQPELFHIVKKKPLPASYSGLTGTISKFQRDGAYKGGYSYNIIVLDFGRMKSFWCDVQGALYNNEIVNTLKTPGVITDKATRLEKLKKLLDSGQISKDEYETLKRKLDNETAQPAPSTKKTVKHTPVVF